MDRESGGGFPTLMTAVPPTADVAIAVVACPLCADFVAKVVDGPED
jgi:hypothetical protein